MKTIGSPDLGARLVYRILKICVAKIGVTVAGWVSGLRLDKQTLLEGSTKKQIVCRPAIFKAFTDI